MPIEIRKLDGALCDLQITFDGLTTTVSKILGLTSCSSHRLMAFAFMNSIMQGADFSFQLGETEACDVIIKCDMTDSFPIMTKTIASQFTGYYDSRHVDDATVAQFLTTLTKIMNDDKISYMVCGKNTLLQLGRHLLSIPQPIETVRRRLEQDGKYTFNTDDYSFVRIIGKSGQQLIKFIHDEVIMGYYYIEELIEPHGAHQIWLNDFGHLKFEITVDGLVWANCIDWPRRGTLAEHAYRLLREIHNNIVIKCDNGSLHFRMEGFHVRFPVIIGKIGPKVIQFPTKIVLAFLADLTKLANDPMAKILLDSVQRNDQKHTKKPIVCTSLHGFTQLYYEDTPKCRFYFPRDMV